jgi:hypothetical protein
MKRETPQLTISFTWDHVAGIFYARLDNGAIIPVKREHLGGKLENALALFARGVAAIAENREYVIKPIRDDSPLIAQAIEKGLLQKVGVIEEDLLDF